MSGTSGNTLAPGDDLLGRGAFDGTRESALAPGQPAVFLDRDGTLIEERVYLHDPEKVVVVSGTGIALRQLQEAGYLLFIVTNQSGIGRGYYTLEAMEAVHRHLLALFARDGVRFKKVYFAPEAPEQPSRGRKPSPQFLFDARAEFGVDLSRSYMIGDKLLDLECGWNAGVARSLLVRTGYGVEVERDSPTRIGAAVVVDNVADAARWILANDQ